MNTIILLALFTEGDAPAPIVFSLPPSLIIALVLTAVLPLLVGLVSNSKWSSRAKAILHAVLSAVTGLLTELGDALASGTPYDLGVGLITAVGVFLAGVALYKGIYAAKGSSGNSIASHLQDVGDDRG